MSDVWNKYLEEKSSTILKCMEDENIFSIEKTDKGFQFIECCDYYYGRTLSKEQMLRLISELQTMAEGK